MEDQPLIRVKTYTSENPILVRRQIQKCWPWENVRRWTHGPPSIDTVDIEYLFVEDKIINESREFLHYQHVPRRHLVSDQRTLALTHNMSSFHSWRDVTIWFSSRLLLPSPLNHCHDDTITVNLTTDMWSALDVALVEERRGYALVQPWPLTEIFSS